MGSISAQRAGTGGASKALSNLANVAINTALVPDIDSSRNLGSAAKFWNDGCFDNVRGPTVFNEIGADVDFRFEGDTEPNLLFLDAGTDRVGVGTAAPNAPLEIVGPKPGGNVGGFQSGMLHVTGDGTAEFSNVVITGHSLFNGNTQLWYFGSTSSFNNDIAFINRQNANLTLYTNNTERVRIEAGGNVVIGASSALGQLHAKQFSATGAKPVLYLEQEDLSEEMIEFDSTIGVGNAIEAIGTKTLTTTHFVKVTVPGGLTRYLPVGTIA